MRVTINWRTFIGLSYLLVQVSSIIYARFSSNRYFVWAPHDIQVEYYLEVYEENLMVPDSVLSTRYRLSSHGWIDLPPGHVIEWLEDYERTQADTSTALIRFRYSINGDNWMEWEKSYNF